MDSFLIAFPVIKQLEQGLHWLLVNIHQSTGLSWAWSIVALTVLVRIAIAPVTAKGTVSMLSMQRLQPHLKQLQQKYKNDRAELNTQMMQFYRDNNVNPLSSCFPILLQLPVFISLFYVLRGFADHPPKAPDDDFSWLFGFVDSVNVVVKDAGVPALILMALYAASQLFSGKVMATSPDPRQRAMMMFLPLAFIPFLYTSFQVGLVLYWLTSNLWTVGQHMVVLRLVDTDKPVVLPQNKKGQKKVLNPKAAKGDAAESGADDAPAPVVRRNKRRR